MTLTEEKVVVIVGSTGVQGGSVARTLLNDGTFAVRALTGDANIAQDFKALGAEVVAADTEDVESLKKEFRDAWGVFGLIFRASRDSTRLVTHSLDFAFHHGNQAETQAHEEQYGRNLTDVAEAEGVQHFVWSTLPYIEAYTVYHFAPKVAESAVQRDIELGQHYEIWGMQILFFAERVTASYSPWTFLPHLKCLSFDADEIGSWVLVALKSERTAYNACGEILIALKYAETGEEHIESLGNELWLKFHEIDLRWASLRTTLAAKTLICRFMIYSLVIEDTLTK
ncbi:hypothetical protein BS47DRAFT_1395760 [Hydnum rufescens UP504]|uniref:NmrA-like domain-containing protein n=1 Tax=Hydnum rufescens UP504 TaxID=1448309 RepID=A0A9P6DTK8_9AGAM|nr:hypothetical protein BS47DRAFT_1395760 [Hydnum rufescens UP504]